MQVRECRYWSTFDEILRFLREKEEDHKVRVIFQQLGVMGKRTVGKSHYPPEVISRAFEYMCTSRALYQRLTRDFQLPSVSTLTKITSKVNNVDELKFIQSIFKGLPDYQRRSVILCDEVYIKSALSYHGGSIMKTPRSSRGQNENRKSIC